MKSMSIFLLMISFSANAYVGLEIGYPQTRFEESESGTPKPFTSASSIDWKVFYQQDSSSRFTWGVSYYSQTIDLSKNNNSFTFDKTDFQRTQISGFIAIGSKEGWFTRFGLNSVTTAYFYEEPAVLDPTQRIIVGEMVKRVDPYILAGIYYKTGFGGGEVSLKLSRLSEVEIDDQKLAGTGCEIYYSMFFNKRQNVGVFFRYLNEETSGDYDHDNEVKSIGVVARI